MNDLVLNSSVTSAVCYEAAAKESTEADADGCLGVDARMLFHSGIGTVIRNILAQWHARPSGPRPMVLVPGEAGVEWAQTHLPRFHIRRSEAPIYSFAEQWSVAARLSRNRILWSPHFNVPLAATSRSVVTIHDVLHLAHPEFFPGALKKWYARGMLAAAVRKARRVITVSEFTASELVRHTGITRSRVTVVHNGVSPRWLEVKPASAPRSRPYFLFVGNIKPHKNLVRLIKAFALLADSAKDYDLVIAGRRDGFITTDHEASREAVALGDRIVFTGYLADAELEQYVAHATALVYPSLYEGFGLPPLEAMAAGCPVVVSEIPPLRESCGNEAIYCDPLSPASIAEALHGVSSLSPEERAHMIAAGRERARAFTWERTAQQTLEVIESVER